MIRHDDFSINGFGRAWLERLGGAEVQGKTAEAKESGISPTDRVSNALRSQRDAREAALASGDFTVAEKDLIIAAGKPPEGSLLAARSEAAEAASKTRKGKYERENADAANSLKGVCDKYGCTIRILPESQNMEHEETVTREENLFTTIGRQLAGDYEQRTTTDTTTENRSNEKLIAYVKPKGGVPYPVRLELSMDDLAKMGQGAEAFVASKLDHDIGDKERKLGFMKKEVVPDKPAITQAKQAPPSARATPSAIPAEAEVVTSQDLAEKGQTNKESTVTPRNS